MTRRKRILETIIFIETIVVVPLFFEAWLKAPTDLIQVELLCILMAQLGVTVLLARYGRHERAKIEEDLVTKSVALESSIDGIAILNSHQCITYGNRALSKLLGFASQNDLIGINWKDLYSSEELERFSKELLPTFKKTGRLRFAAQGRRRDGTSFPQEISLTSIPGGGFVCTVADISEKKRAEDSVIESQKFLAKVIDANPNFIFVKDYDGRFKLGNRAVAQAYGTTVEGLLGKSDADFNPNAAEVAHFLADDRLVMDTQRDRLIQEESITDADGNMRWLQTIKRALRFGPNDEMHVLGVATDITERKKLQDQLIQAQKMEAIGQLAGGIAHDFNNLLTGILGYTALLKTASRGLFDIERAAEMIESTAKRAAQLTEKLLGFARGGKNQNIPVDLHTTIKETVALLSRTVEKNITIDLSMAAENSNVLGDPVQLQQVILNLAINARDAMRSDMGGCDGGAMRISTRVVTSIETPTIHEAAANEGAYLEVAFADTGCGIDQKLHAKIFEPFFTTKEPGKGTGMGLAMVYGIVRNHGGAITVESQPGEGTTFRVFLPIAAPQEKLIVEKINTSTVSGKGHILIVDDHHVIRDVTSRMLTSLGYDVVTAKDGLEAIRYYEDNGDDIDLVILDMVMPNMGARECLRAIRKINPNVRAILSTGYGHNHAVQEIMNEGAAGFVQKPYQLTKLSEVVAEVLSH